MKNDPYAQLTGLDRRLFQEDKPSPPTTKQRDNETTLPRDNVRSNETTSAASSQRDNVSSKQRNSAGSRERAGAPSKERSGDATRTRTSSAAGHHVPVRIDERHSHDIFRDQVRWMNRIKLEIEESHGARITSNAIVQLAIDLLISDYERQGDGSALMTVLVHGQPLLDWLREEAS